MIKRALISVYDKRGIVELARFLASKGIELISTSGTAKLLKDNGLEIVDVSSVTGFKEILDGRVKTLHPSIMGGILARRKDQLEELSSFGIEPIDLVIVNLYPFEDVIKNGADLDEALENIDIGGVTLIRASAKNFADVVILTDPNDYALFMKEFEEEWDISYETRKSLAIKAFAITSRYDSIISTYLDGSKLPRYFLVSGMKFLDLRYGENPHQSASAYITSDNSILKAKQMQGKELSYNNILDLDIAWSLVRSFDKPCVGIIKHNIPCGVAIASDILSAFINAWNADPVSAFGSIIGINREITEEVAKAMDPYFIECIICPSITNEALDVLRHKKNLRIMVYPDFYRPVEGLEIKGIQGGFLVQDWDTKDIEEFKVVTQTPLDESLKEDLIFAYKVVKFVKSNAIVVAKDGKTLGIGGGQPNRVDSVRLALSRAGKEAQGAVLASDGFFPFPDSVEEAGKAGIKAIIQPGGSIRDKESIEMADKFSIAMVFTGIRHFRH
ncbi:MAG: bifunctional phosphoribosylaminoimidazolecarboxamide formyltransferase/IMP cyclohydrolase [bacterium]|nr:bifunctional phosphoribosylaminoimidazolecarboxamide formyltransferase/IMP cyclohydrolase [bacterium]